MDSQQDQAQQPKADDAQPEEVASSIFDAINSYDEKSEAKDEPSQASADGKAPENAPQDQSAQQQQFLLQQQQM